MLQRILVWDIPTRVFHWTLVASFAGAYLTSETERYRDLHVALGYLFLGMIVFRLIWGFVGTTYARFSSFLYSPSTLTAYMRSLLAKNPQHYMGHNPAGALAIFLLLALGLMIGISGVLLYWEVGGEEAFEELHEIAANGMLALVFVHIAGVMVSSVLHKENLARAMVIGYKTGEPAQGIGRSYAGLGLSMILAIVAFLVWYLR